MGNEDMFKREYLAIWNDARYKDLYEAYDRLLKLENDIRCITGYTLTQLKELFLAGYTLKAPENYII